MRKSSTCCRCCQQLGKFGLSSQVKGSASPVFMATCTEARMQNTPTHIYRTSRTRPTVFGHIQGLPAGSRPAKHRSGPLGTTSGPPDSAPRPLRTAQRAHRGSQDHKTQLRIIQNLSRICRAQHRTSRTHQRYSGQLYLCK